MQSEASSGLFSIFVISIFSLCLFPYTIYALCCSDDGTAVEPWQKARGVVWGGQWLAISRPHLQVSPSPLPASSSLVMRG